MRPDDLLPYIDTPTSTGPFVKALLLSEPVGTVLIAFDEMKSRRETCEMLEKVTGQPFAYIQEAIEEIAQKVPLFGMEAAQSGTWHGEYGFFGEKVEGWKDGLTWPKDLQEPVQTNTLYDWIEKQDWTKALAIPETA